MKNVLFILSFAALILFASCRKDKMNTPSSPVAVDTLSTGWTKIKFIDTSSLYDVFFINNTGFAAGSNIYKSSDGGENWTRLSTSSTPGSPIASIGMGSEKNAIFVTPDHLLITHNGGASFITETLADNALSDVFFIDSTVAYAAGTSVWKTTDGGDNWMKLYDFTPGGGFTSVFFTSLQTGWILKADGAYKTINGGTDWQRMNTDTINLFPGGAIYCLNADTGYISNNLSVYKTVNGGTSWNKVFTGTHADFHDIHFVSESDGYITDGPYIFKTTDSGNTWTKVVAVPASTHNVYELHFTDPNHGWACGDKGLILKYGK